MKSLIISGPSGVGKSTLINYLLKKNSNFKFCISHTSRKIRNNEINGKDYNFIKKFEFESMIKNNDFLEYTKFSSNFYGTSFNEIQKIINEEKIPILDVEWNGVKNIKKKLLCNIFLILPENIDILKNRLIKRNTDEIDSINLRLNQAKLDIKEALDKKIYDEIIYNNNWEESYKDFLNKLKNYYNLNLN